MKKDVQTRMYESLAAQMTEKAAGLVKEILDTAGDGEWTDTVCMLSGLTADELRAAAKGENRLRVKEMIAFVTGVLNAYDLCENKRTDENFEAEESDRIYSLATQFLQEWVSEVGQIVEYEPAFADSLLRKAGAADDEMMLGKYHLFMDASALCEPGMSEFLDKVIVAAAGQVGVKLVTVPKTVVTAIMKMAQNPIEGDLMGATNGMSNLQKLQKAGLLSIRGDEGDITVLSTFVSAFSRFKPVNHLLLFTCDNALADAVGMLNRSGIEGDDILIGCVNSEGVACCWGEEKNEADQEAESTQAEPMQDNSTENVPEGIVQSGDETQPIAENNYSEADPVEESEWEDPEDEAEWEEPEEDPEEETEWEESEEDPEEEPEWEESEEDPEGEPEWCEPEEPVWEDLEDTAQYGEDAPTPDETVWIEDEQESDGDPDEEGSGSLSGFESDTWNLLQ